MVCIDCQKSLRCLQQAPPAVISIGWRMKSLVWSYMYLLLFSLIQHDYTFILQFGLYLRLALGNLHPLQLIGNKFFYIVTICLSKCLVLAICISLITTFGTFCWSCFLC